MQIDAYIAMGSNLGDRHANIKGGLDAIGALDSTEIIRCSTIIETDPVGPGDQQKYLNAVVAIRTVIAPKELLKSLLEIEAMFGRDRSSGVQWESRTLDLDVLVYGDQLIDEPGLTIPHPRLHTRSFVLIPLCEIAPDIILPGYKKTPQALLGVLDESML